MYVRKKPNKSGRISVQIIDKSTGRYKVVKTIGSSTDPLQLEKLVAEGKRYIQSQTGVEELDFTDHKKVYADVLASIHSHKLVVS